MGIGTKHWAITEGWNQPRGDAAVAFLNNSSQEAHVQIFVSYNVMPPGLASLQPDPVAYENMDL